MRAVEYDRSAAQCYATGLTLSDPSSGKAEPVQLENQIAEQQMERPFSIVCKRTKTPSQSGNRYSRFTLGIDTNLGTYSVKLPPEEVLGFDLASESKLKYERVSAELDKQRLLATKLTGQLNQANKRITGLTNQIRNTPTEVHLVKVGQKPDPLWSHLKCYANLNDHATEICNGRPSTIQHIHTHDGDSCGYNYYVMKCAKP